MSLENTEYRVNVDVEGKQRVTVSVDSRRKPTDDVEVAAPWRPMGISASGETIYEALAKLGKDAKRKGELREGLRERVGR